MKILILAAGNPPVSAEDNYPLWLTEFRGRPLIEQQIERCLAVDGAEIIVALSASDIARFHLDDVVKLLSPRVRVLSIHNPTRGALCTALLAVEHFVEGEDLLVLNGDELVDVDISDVVASFREAQYTAGTLTFDSIHPRYSYARIGEDGLVIEFAEKRPISKHATVGFYWFNDSADFVASAKAEIRDDNHIDGQFYVCPALNQLILLGHRVGALPLAKERFHPLKTDRQVSTYENELERPEQP